MADIKVDTSDFKAKVEKLLNDAHNKTKKAVLDVALDVLRLSQVQVPHDIGTLQNSGHVEPFYPADEVLVGYNTVYAARLHEHPEYNFTGAPQRKGKYLEDPIKNNLSTFLKYFQDILR